MDDTKRSLDEQRNEIRKLMSRIDKLEREINKVGGAYHEFIGKVAAVQGKLDQVLRLAARG